MRVLFVTAEMKPFAKTGGLGDVVSELPRALRAAGVDARVIMPLYGPIKARFHDQLQYLFSYSFTRRNGTGEVYVHTINYEGTPVYFLESWPNFGEGNYIYTDVNWDRERFVFFSQAALGLVWQLNMGRHGDANWFPDVIHAHDWHTALIPFLMYEGRFMPLWNRLASVLTVHNMGYQGWDSSYFLYEAGIPFRYHPELQYFHKGDNLLGIGLAYAHKLNTVSPRHAIELHYPRFGEGLEGMVWARDADFSGILNGIDVDKVNPATDKNIPHPYDETNFREMRAKNKVALQLEMNINPDPNVPLIGVVSRLVDQKGMDIAAEGLRRLLATTEAQLVLVGTGDPDLENQMRQLEWDFGWKARIVIAFRPELAAKIYAGADLILVPSRYEPCGLTQLHAQRYGALPVVRETGGLADTVINYDNNSGDHGTGFTFLFEEPNAVQGTLAWAIDVYRNRRDAFERMQARVMKLDLSWDRPVQQYMALYEAALAKARAWENG